MNEASRRTGGWCGVTLAALASVVLAGADVAGAQADSPLPGAVNCQVKGRISFSLPVRVKAKLTGCTATEGGVGIRRGTLTGTFDASPIDPCAPLLATLAGATARIDWVGGEQGSAASPAPTRLRVGDSAVAVPSSTPPTIALPGGGGVGVATGSFAGAVSASLTSARRASDLAAACAGGAPIRTLPFAGTVSVGQAPTHAIARYASAVIAPLNIASGPDGALWFTNGETPALSTGAVATITTTGRIRTFTENAGWATSPAPDVYFPSGIAAGPDGAVWFTNRTLILPVGLGLGEPTACSPSSGRCAPTVGRITTDGVITNVPEPSDSLLAAGAYEIPIATGADGTLWAPLDPNSATMARVAPTGVVSLRPFTGCAETATAMALGPDGRMWVVCDRTLVAIATDGTWTRSSIVGSGRFGDVVVGADGDVWLTVPDADQIVRVASEGVETVFTDPSISQPYRIVFGIDGALWFTNPGNDSIGRITTSGDIANFSDPPDQPKTITRPRDIAAGPDGALWFTMGWDEDTRTGAIGRITP